MQTITSSATGLFLFLPTFLNMGSLRLIVLNVDERPLVLPKKKSGETFEFITKKD